MGLIGSSDFELMENEVIIDQIIDKENLVKIQNLK